MKKIFLDTNIWLHSLLQDNNQAKDCAELITQIEQGKFLSYTSAVVLLEVNFVLTFTYKISSKQACGDLEKILKTRGITVIDKTNTKKAIKIYRKHRIKFTDCLIATQLPPKTTLVTYDRDFQKIPRLNPLTPKEVLDKS